MRWLNRLKSILRHLFFAARVEHEINREVGSYLDLLTKENLQRGMTPDEARRRARIEIGGTEQVKQRIRDDRHGGRLEGICQDLRYAIRSLLRHPGASGLVVIVMAVAIGANTTVFTIVNGVFLEPVPYEDPDRIVTIARESPQYSPNYSAMNVEALAALREASRTLSSAGGYIAGLPPRTVETDRGVAEQSLGRVSANFIGEILRVQPHLGRSFVPDDELPGAPPVALIAHAFWQGHSGGAPDAIGETLRLAQLPPLEIVGVLPPGFRSPRTPEEPEGVWTLIGTGEALPNQDMFTVLGRLAPGTTIDNARTELSVLEGSIVSAGGERMEELTEGATLRMDPVADFYTTDEEQTAILMFFAAVLAVLLIGVANLAGVELARLPAFEGTMAVRAAMGATRGQLVRFMLTRSLVLGLSGGLLGTVAALALNRILLANLPASVPRRLDLRADVRVLAFSIGLSLAASVLIGLVPALRASRPDVRTTMHSSSKSFTSDRKYRLFQNALTAFQTGTALVLLIGAGLLIHNYWRISTVDMGFDYDEVVVATVAPPPAYQGAAFTRFFSDTLERLESVDDVRAAAVSTALPLFLSGGLVASAVDAEGNRRELTSRNRDSNGVSPGFFETMGIPLLSGRTFTAEEDRDAARVAVVSESVVRDLFPGENPLGRVLTWERGEEAVDLTVIGVAGEYRNSEINERRSATLYVPSGMRLPEVASERVSRPFRRVFVVVKTSMAPDTVGQVVGSIEPEARIDTTTIRERMTARNASESFRTQLLAGFAGIALSLAGVGVYTVLAHLVGHRTREFGVRMALGASRGDVFVQVFRRVLPPAAIGMMIGLVVASAFKDSLIAYTFVIQPGDAPTYTAVSFLLIVVILADCAIPALRASRLDPVTALRHE